jgi:adenylate cyclase
MEAAAPSAYRFDRFVLHLDRGALLVDGVECALRPKSFSLLRHFVENPGRIVSRDEIMQVVWPGIFVSDDSMFQCVLDIRRALGDHEQRMLRTLPRRGYLPLSYVERNSEPNSLRSTTSKRQVGYRARRDTRDRHLARRGVDGQTLC